ncbi:MAG: hypothetical protein MJZ77_06930, partial [Bacteroidales bacterium]|nr:hypothetical protein [Bacteroidales bacterium]
LAASKRPWRASKKFWQPRKGLGEPQKKSGSLEKALASLKKILGYSLSVAREWGLLLWNSSPKDKKSGGLQNPPLCRVYVLEGMFLFGFFVVGYLIFGNVYQPWEEKAGPQIGNKYHDGPKITHGIEG